MEWLLKVNSAVEAIAESGICDYQPRSMSTITFYFSKGKGKMLACKSAFLRYIPFFLLKESSNFPCNQYHFPKASSQITIGQLVIWVRV